MSTKMQLTVLKPETLTTLDTLAIAVRDGVAGDKAPFSEVLGLAIAVTGLRDALTEEVMRSVMALQGRPIGFLTDKDKDGGYTMDVVRDVAIEAMTHGARLVGNELNIIAKRCYLTKGYFQRRLNEALGAGNWYFKHGLPELAEKSIEREKDGRKYSVSAISATVTTLVRWRIAGEWQEQELVHTIKGDSYATAEAYLGKADRKCGSWLYQRVTGRIAPDGDASDYIDVTAAPAAEPPRVSPLERSTTVSTASTAAPAPAVKESVTTAESATAQTVADPAAKPRMSAPERAKLFREIVLEVGATAMNGFLQSIGWIRDEQSYRDVTETQMETIINGREGFVAKAKAKANGGK